MQYVNLGQSGLKVSRLCVGAMSFGVPGEGPHTWTLAEPAARPIIKAALDAGINFFDTANIYSNGTSEQILGRALRDFARRDEIVVATKCHGAWREAPNTGGLSRKAIFEAVDDSLRRLGMEYIDLYQIHRLDPSTPIEETLTALHDLVRAGKVLYLGASSMYAWEFERTLMLARQNRWTAFISMQNHYNLLYREEEREMLPLCRDQAIGVIPWSPLARGRLTRPWDTVTTRSDTDRVAQRIYASDQDNDRSIVDALAVVAAEHGVSMAQMALAWLLGTPGVTAPIVGVTRLEQLNEAVAALGLELSPGERQRLEAPYRPHAVSGIR